MPHLIFYILHYIAITITMKITTIAIYPDYFISSFFWRLIFLFYCRNPSLKVVDSYVGLKQELVKKGENRNYLYHINQTSPNVWTVVLGKFTLAFSMAPEFYRRVYNKNPNKIVKVGLSSEINPVLSETAWQEIISNKRR